MMNLIFLQMFQCFKSGWNVRRGDVFVIALPVFMLNMFFLRRFCARSGVSRWSSPWPAEESGCCGELGSSTKSFC